MNSEKKRASKSLSFSMQAMALLFVLLMTYTRTWSQCPGSVTITPVLISCNGAGDGELTASLAGSGPYT
mgnify:FL=1